MTMKQQTGGMKQAMDLAKKASEVDDDAVTIAADDAGATAATQKIGEALENDQPEDVTSEIHEADDRTQQATSPIGLKPHDGTSERERELIKQARENARLTDDMMVEGGFGKDVETE
jgi:hypothetical protein